MDNRHTWHSQCKRNEMYVQPGKTIKKYNVVVCCGDNRGKTSFK